MKRLFTIILITLMTFLSSNIKAQEVQSPLSLYKPTYFTMGDMENQTKYQFSFMYALLYPFNIGLYFGYTQTSLWKIYDKSSPFIDTNYNPEFFYSFKNGNNIFNDTVISEHMDFDIGFYEHKSNGRDDIESRGMDRAYAKLNLYTYVDLVEMGVSGKVWYYYNLSRKNTDYYEYSGPGEVEVFAQLHRKGNSLDQERIYVKGGVGGTYFGREVKGNENHWGYSGKGWIEAGLSLRIISVRVQPYLFLNYYYGYNEFMLEYNEKTEHAVRIGFTLK